MSKSLEERLNESFKYGGSSEYLDTLYEEYLEDASKVTYEWREFFDSIQNSEVDKTHSELKEFFRKSKNQPKHESNLNDTSGASDVMNLVDAYRRRGHEVAKTNPLKFHLSKFHNL